MGPSSIGPLHWIGLGAWICILLLNQKIPSWTSKLLLLGALGGLQGAIGWWMVHSGLGGEMLDVASYRLATHLGLAFVILASSLGLFCKFKQ